jgi:hypothetical protein
MPRSNLSDPLLISNEYAYIPPDVDLPADGIRVTYGDPVAVPSPALLPGSLVALGFGVFLRRKQALAKGDPREE